MLGRWDGLVRGEAFEEEEYRLVTKDGRLKWMSASWGPLLDDSGTQVGVQGRERDVTARKLAELALRDSERHLRRAEKHYHTLFDDSPVPMWEEDFSRVKELLDEHAELARGDWSTFLEARPELVEECVRRVRIPDVNRSAVAFYGASSREQLKAGLAVLFDQAAYEIFRRELAVFAGGGHLFQAVLDVRDLKGAAHTVQMFVSLEPAHTGDWSRVIVAFVEITGANQLNEEYLQSQKMESLGRFAGAVAHDINNVLTLVNGYCDLLLTRLREDDPSLPWVHEIRRAGQTGAALMNQLLTFSRRQPVQAGPLSLNSLVREVEPMIRRLAGEDVSVLTSLDPAAGDVNADAALMRQLLLNLVANAREAMPRGGVRTMETRLVCLGPNREEQPPSGKGRPAVVLRVSDTGVGMDDDVRQHLFEPSFTTKRQRLGSGLALASVFGIVNQQGGHIQVASQPGKGSTFSIYLDQLPAAKDQLPGLGEPAQPGEQTPGFGTALVAEDQPEVRALAGAILRRMGFQVLEAANGQEALAVAERHPGPIQLLLTGVVMPVMNGFVLADRLIALRPGMRVVYMSGYADQDLDGSGRLANSRAFLLKPFTPDALAALIRRTLANWRAAAG